MRRKCTALICALVVAGCTSTLPENKPRLLITVETSRTEITPADTVTLTFRAQNIGDVPLEISNYVKRDGIVTANLGAGQWGLMSPDYLFARGGPVSALTLFAFRLEAGQHHVIKSEFALKLEGYTFPEGIYFADAHLWDQSLRGSIDVKIIPAIIKFRHAR